MRFHPQFDAERKEPHINCYCCNDRIPESAAHWMDGTGYCDKCWNEIKTFAAEMAARLRQG